MDSVNRDARTLPKPVVLITGAEGRLGKAIGAQLGDAYRVVGLELACQGADCINADITSQESLAQACATLRTQYGNRLASVIHLAAFYDFSGEPNPLYAQVNVQGTAHLLRALQSFEVEQFIYASTMLVHAPTVPGQPISEDGPLAPAWPYPQSKLEAEQVVNAERGTMATLILRLAGVYTPDCDVPSLAYQIQRIFERERLSRVFPGNAAHGQSFVHLDDVAQAFRAAVDRRAQLPPQATVLVGEPVTESYEALQNLIGRCVHGEAWGALQIPKSLAATGAWLQDKIEDVVPDAIDRGLKPFVKPFMVALADAHYELDIARAEHLLGWHPEHTLRRSLPAIVGKLRQDPAYWYQRNKIPLPLWLEKTPDGPGPALSAVEQCRTLERREHQQTLWCHFANVALGVWLMCAPFTFGLTDTDTWTVASDVIAGALIVVLGLLSLSLGAGWARWSVATLGVWLLFAPLLFWTPSAAAYANDTLVGSLAIIFAVGIPTAPGINPLARMDGPDVPPGWDYSPSDWTNRIPIIVLAFVGLFISRYLAAYQLGHIDAAFDPLFGDGTERVITSSVSEAWPVPDAGLGALVYVLEIVTGVIGDKRRWRTMPWLVLLFGVLIVPLGVVSVLFIIIQPIVIGTWCTLCLVGALAMLLQIPYSLDEIIATLQFLKNRRQQGMPLWYLLWHGDRMEGGRIDNSNEFEAPARTVVRNMLVEGVNMPWTLLVSTALGIALMCTRLLFGTEGAAADNDHLIGSLVVTFSIIAWGHAARPVRFINIAFGAWLVMAPALVPGYAGVAAVASLLCGIALIWLALPMGRISTHMGAWDRVANFRLHISKSNR
ncbi:MAG: DNA polymerase III subunit epsilon [Burkholderiales bacterium RIFCSPLOWO2_12_FULL_61_40]|nr:MAG: DNA polymerase III subunit epsilon [Burkholderiales bacterium RIFCSPLOWO2_12_FULL_61_40]